MSSILSALLMVTMLHAAEPNEQSPTTTTPGPKITTKDAKKSCKDEGKTGADLIQCMKDKKETK